MNTPKPLYQVIASTLTAYHNCVASAEWKPRHAETLRSIEKNLLPSGAGIDSGCTFDLDARGNLFRLSFAYHHMNDGGFYDGWTEHALTVRPAFEGIELRISGRDRNEVKEYLYQTFEHALTRPVTWSEESGRYIFAAQEDLKDETLREQLTGALARLRDDDRTSKEDAMEILRQVLGLNEDYCAAETSRRCGSCGGRGYVPDEEAGSRACRDCNSDGHLPTFPDEADPARLKTF